MVRVAAVLLALALAGCTQSESSATRALRAQVLLPARQVFGSCLTENPARTTRMLLQGEFIRCGLKPRPGFVLRGKVVGATPLLVDTMGEPPFGRFCPQETDDVVRARLPSGESALLCLDNVPAYGNPGGLGERAFDRFE